MGYPFASEEEAIGKEEGRTQSSVLFKECDFLIPSSTHQAINYENAPLLNCKVVIEGASCATTFYAEEVLS